MDVRGCVGPTALTARAKPNFMGASPVGPITAALHQPRSIRFHTNKLLLLFFKIKIFLVTVLKKGRIKKIKKHCVVINFFVYFLFFNFKNKNMIFLDNIFYSFDIIFTYFLRIALKNNYINI